MKVFTMGELCRILLLSCSEECRQYVS